MEKLKFKTNIKCSGCVAAVTPFLNRTVGENHWQVDVQNPDKVLTVDKENNVTDQSVIEAIQAAGYKAEAIS